MVHILYIAETNLCIKHPRSDCLALISVLDKVVHQRTEASVFTLTAELLFSYCQCNMQPNRYKNSPHWIVACMCTPDFKYSIDIPVSTITDVNE